MDKKKGTEVPSPSNKPTLTGHEKERKNISIC